MINYDAVNSKFVRIASTWLSSDVNAVIRAHQNGPQPDRPYVVFDILDTQDEDGWETHRYVDDDDYPTYEVHKQLLLSYSVVGEGSLQIANKLRNMFLLDRIKEEVRADLGAGIVSVDRVRDLPKVISDKLFDDMSEFEVVINMTDSVTDTEGHIITSTEFTVEISKDELDPSPYITTFDVDNIP